MTHALPEVATGQHGPAFEDLTISDGAGSTARLDRTDNGGFLVTETGAKSNTCTTSGTPGADPTANATDSPSTDTARQSGSTNHPTRQPGPYPAGGITR